MKKIFLSLLIALAVSACGSSKSYEDRRTGNNPSNPHSPSDPWIVVARTSVSLTMGGGYTPYMALVTYQGTGNVVSAPVTVTMGPNATMTTSTASFAVPASVTNGVLSFGSINITNLTDNNLKVCGGGSTKCTSAAIRVYTSGQPGDGFWNAADAYGVPLSAAVGANPLTVTGLGVANAAYVETFVITATKHSMTQADFSPAPNVLISGDFTNAGTGTYTTTVNVEFVVGL